MSSLTPGVEKLESILRQVKEEQSLIPALEELDKDPLESLHLMLQLGAGLTGLTGEHLVQGTHHLLHQAMESSLAALESSQKERFERLEAERISP